MVGLVTILTVVLVGCSIPHQRDGDASAKLAATRVQVANLIDEYSAVRALGDERRDPSILRRVESGQLLDIDSGVYFVSARVTPTEPLQPVRLTGPRTVVAPRFTRYPMWFAALADDEEAGTRRLAVFERADSLSPWLMTAAPELEGDSGLPGLEIDGDGAAESVAADDGDGLAFAPQAALDSYARALSNKSAAERDLFDDDPFLQGTADFQQAQENLPHASFAQSWSAQEVRHAVRLADGGALVVGTLSRSDEYEAADDSYIDWTDNAAAKAYLPGRVFRSARLSFSHQVLLRVPPKGKARLLGQYGGVVDGQGS